MSLAPLYGHDVLRTRLLERIGQGNLPQSLLLHGDAGVGKQRLALWLAGALLCENTDRPCGRCRHCRYVAELTHPDLTWIFPRPRSKDADASPDDVKIECAEASRERAEANGLYAAPSGSDGIYVATVRVLVRLAQMTPALATRKVFVVGDAERMVPQEGSEFAANAFLKLLEEPPADTFLILTSSAPGALLPTIRSRVAAIRVPRLAEDSVRAFLADPAVVAALDKLPIPKGTDERVAIAAGAPGALLESSVRDEALGDARRFIEVAQAGNRAELYKLAFTQGQSGARGGFSDILDALTFLLHERMRRAALDNDSLPAAAAARAIDHVEHSRELAGRNVNPQLIAVELLNRLATTLA